MNRIKISLFVLILFSFLNCSNDDDSSQVLEINISQNEESIPPPDNNSYFITNSFNPGGPKGLLWSVDLIKWTNWNVDYNISHKSIFDGENVIFYKEGEENSQKIYVSNGGFDSLIEIINVPQFEIQAGIYRNKTLILISNWNKIHSSTDHGESWNTIGLNELENDYLTFDNLNVFFIYNKFTIVAGKQGVNSYLIESFDGINWTQRIFSFSFNRVKSNQNFQILYNTTNNKNRFYISNNNIDETKEIEVPITYEFFEILLMDDQLICFSNEGGNLNNPLTNLIVSNSFDNGLTWLHDTSNFHLSWVGYNSFHNKLNQISSFGDYFITYSLDFLTLKNKAFFSLNGKDWDEINHPNLKYEYASGYHYPSQLFNQVGIFYIDTYK